ncbi:MAG: DNA recombination protein RmuC [Fimbriimonadaceae bacterium]|nr:DNA recombination protein RmuC [Fimbriimonadaceae bacterium]
MDATTLTTILLAVVALFSCATVVWLIKAKTESAKVHKQEIDTLNDKLTEAAKSVGKAEELNRTLDSVRQDRTTIDDKLQTVLEEVNRLTEELSIARTERDSAQRNSEQQIQAERETCATTIEREKSTCAELIQREKEACQDILLAKDQEIKAKDIQIENLKLFIDKASETLGTHFKALSHETLKDVSAQFEKAAKQVIEQNSETTAQNVKLHKEQIEKLLQPVGLTLDQLNQLVKDTNEKRGEAEAVLMEKIKDFAGANEKLANALNKPVIRGSFAETKLESLLEAAGLVRGENFELQVPVKDGDQQRTVDALVDMAQGKKLVIDSKNLLLPFVEYANAPEDQREARLLDFQRAFRTTLKALSIKDYAKHWEGIDAVIMFLPDEGMYMAAIESDRQLIATMFEQRVFTVSPVSLLPILKSVAYILGLEKQNRDTQTIVDAGRALYESLGVILGKINTLGDRMEASMEAYNGVIASFEGNVLPKARQLRELGIQRGAAHKDIPIREPLRREFKDRVTKELAGSMAIVRDEKTSEVKSAEKKDR